MLEGGDLLRVGRPEQNRPVTLGPSGVVGGVSEVLDTIGGDLGLFSILGVADPEVVVTDEGGLGAVGGKNMASKSGAARRRILAASP